MRLPRGICGEAELKKRKRFWFYITTIRFGKYYLRLNTYKDDDMYKYYFGEK